MTTTKAAHTPGPWEVMPRGNLKARGPFILAGNFTIAECQTRDQEANARLIAAAPELAADREILCGALLQIMNICNQKNPSRLKARVYQIAADAAEKISTAKATGAA